jgi:hypothetical protein
MALLEFRLDTEVAGIVGVLLPVALTDHGIMAASSSTALGELGETAAHIICLSLMTNPRTAEERRLAVDVANDVKNKAMSPEARAMVAQALVDILQFGDAQMREQAIGKLAWCGSIAVDLLISTALAKMGQPACIRLLMAAANCKLRPSPKGWKALYRGYRKAPSAKLQRCIVRVMESLGVPRETTAA